MSVSTLLQIILFINIFIVGVVASAAYRHAYAHFRPPKPDKTDEHLSEELPPEVRERLLKNSEAKFQKVLENSAVYLQGGLVATATDLNNLVKNLVTEIINSELANYHKELAEMRKHAEAEMSTVRTEMDGHKDDLKTKLAAEMAAEKQHLLKQIDTKLADAVGSFLVETLGHDVDLGSQSDYLTGLLEKHKAEFAREVANDADIPSKAEAPAVEKTKEVADDKAKPAN